MHPPSLSNHRLFNVFGYADDEVEVDGKGKDFERLLRGVRSGLHRGKREETQARRSVEQQIRSEVCESLTARLLSCELAMAVPEVPAPRRGKNPHDRQSRRRRAAKAED